MEEFTWKNFISLWKGSLLEKRMFVSIVFIGVCQLIFIANWAVSWTAGGYLTTSTAIVSFFVHFYGFYSVWNRNPGAQLLYLLVLFCLCLLYIVTVVLTILSITLNTEFQDPSEEIPPVLTFKLDGIAGEEGTELFFYIILIIINFVVVILTFALLFLVSRIRKLVLEEKRSNMLNLQGVPSPGDRSQRTSIKVEGLDYNIPGISKKIVIKNLVPASRKEENIESSSLREEHEKELNQNL